MYKISIITVCYNAINNLKKTVASVLEQSYAPIEYILVDGGSTDGSLFFIEELAKKNKEIQWVSEADEGIYDAMNKGVRMAQGQWILFLNAGDTMATPTTIEQIIPYLEKATAYGVVYGDIQVENGTEIVIRRASVPRDFHRMFCCHQAMINRRDLLEKYPFAKNHRLSADLHWVKRLLKMGVKMQQVDLVIAQFDTQGVSNTHVEEGLRDNIAVVKELDRGLFKWVHLCRLYWKIGWRHLTKRS